MAATAARTDACEDVVTTATNPQTATVLDASQVWRSFVEFRPAGWPARDTLVACEYGVFPFTGAPRFTVGLVREVAPARRLVTTARGARLSCELLYEATEDLQALGTGLARWTGGSAVDVDQWLTELRARPEWEALDGHRPLATRSWLEEW